jgi:hypothetical protein
VLGADLVRCVVLLYGLARPNNFAVRPKPERNLPFHSSWCRAAACAARLRRLAARRSAAGAFYPSAQARVSQLQWIQFHLSCLGQPMLGP